MAQEPFGPTEERLRAVVERDLDAALGPEWRSLPLGGTDGVSTALRALARALAEHNRAVGQALQSHGLGLTGF